MSKENKAQTARKPDSLSERLSELGNDAIKPVPPASSITSPTTAPPPLPSPTSAAKSARKSTESATPPPQPKTANPPPPPSASLLGDKAESPPAGEPIESLLKVDEKAPDTAKIAAIETSGDGEAIVPAGILPKSRDAVDNPPPEPDADRRTAQRRPAGPSRERIAANDDAPSIGGLIYALNQRPSNRPFAFAAGATGLWAAIALGFSWAFVANNIDWSTGFVGITTHPSFLTAVATIIGPIVLFWFLAFLLWRTDELHLRSTAMTEVAVRLAEPDRMAEQSVASLGQAVRRQVSFMNDAVTRALGRAGELEALVHNEVSSLEQSYEDNERKIRGLIQELSGERHALLNTGDRFKDTLLQLGTEVPQLIEKLSNQQLKLAHIIEHAGTNLTQLESAIGGQTEKLETALGDNTGRLQSVLEDYTGALAAALSSRTGEMRTMLGGYAESLDGTLNTKTTEMQVLLTGYTEALGGALGNRTEQMQTLLEDNRKAIDTSLETMGATLSNRTETMQTLLEDNRKSIDSSLGTIGDTLSNHTETMQVVFEEYARALDSTLASRTETFDIQLVERTKALDEAFGERLKLFDEAIMRSTLSIDHAVGDNAKALSSALEHHAESFNESLSQQALQLDQTLVSGIDAVRSTSENNSRQSIKAIEGLASQSDMLRNVSENLLSQINNVSNRFENQGQTIMRSANALETANFRIDKMLADRSDVLNSTLDRMSDKADELGTAFSGYSENLEGSISHAHERAKLLTQDLTRETEQHARATVDNLQRLKAEATREADQALEDLRSEFASVSREVTQRLGNLSDQFSQTTGEVRDKAARAAQELEDEQGRLKQQLELLPQASEENAIAMRRALQDQLKALDQLSELAQRTAVQSAAVPPASERPIPLREMPTRQPVQPAAPREPSRPLASLTSTLAREMSERLARSTASQQPQAPSPTPLQSQPQQQPAEQRPLEQPSQPTQSFQPTNSALANAAARPAPTGQPDGQPAAPGNWSFVDLLARVSDEEREPEQPLDHGSASPAQRVPDSFTAAPRQEPAAPTPDPQNAKNAGIDIASLAQALDRGAAAAIWSRFRNGQRGFMVRSIYAPEARQLFDDIVYRYQNQPMFRANVDQFVQEFERTLRESDQRDPRGELTQAQVTSDPGRVYLLFAHASQRLV